MSPRVDFALTDKTASAGTCLNSPRGLVGQFEIVPASVFRFANQRYVAQAVKEPHANGDATTSHASTRDVVVSGLPPWMPDHAAARRTRHATTPVRSATIAPVPTAISSRRIGINGRIVE